MKASKAAARQAQAVESVTVQLAELRAQVARIEAKVDEALRARAAMPAPVAPVEQTPAPAKKAAKK